MHALYVSRVELVSAQCKSGHTFASASERKLPSSFKYAPYAAIHPPGARRRRPLSVFGERCRKTCSGWPSGVQWTRLTGVSVTVQRVQLTHDDAVGRGSVQRLPVSIDRNVELPRRVDVGGQVGCVGSPACQLQAGPGLSTTDASARTHSRNLLRIPHGAHKLHVRPRRRIVPDMLIGVRRELEDVSRRGDERAEGGKHRLDIARRRAWC